MNNMPPPRMILANTYGEWFGLEDVADRDRLHLYIRADLAPTYDYDSDKHRAARDLSRSHVDDAVVDKLSGVLANLEQAAIDIEIYLAKWHGSHK